ALPAVARQTRPFFLSEVALPWILDHFREGLLVDIADLVFRQNVMIAGIKIAVVLDDRHIAAGLAVDTKRVLHSQERSHGFVEELDENLSHVLPHPLIEDRAKKLAVGRR